MDAGAYSQGGQYIEFYDINGFFGDSGAGVFNSRGQLVAVVSMMFQQVGNGYMKLMGSFPLAFTDEQWHEAERG